jgi:hypothetical protein
MSHSFSSKGGEDENECVKKRNSVTRKEGFAGPLGCAHK